MRLAFDARSEVRTPTLTLAQARRVARSRLARAGVVVVTLTLAGLALGRLSFFVVRADRLGTTLQWGLCWTHYAAAPSSARRPVDLFLLGALALASLTIGSTRLGWARRIWREIDNGESL